MRNKRRALDMSRLGLFHLQNRNLEHIMGKEEEVPQKESGAHEGKRGGSAPEKESGAHEGGKRGRKCPEEESGAHEVEKREEVPQKRNLEQI